MLRPDTLSTLFTLNFNEPPFQVAELTALHDTLEVEEQELQEERREAALQDCHRRGMLTQAQYEEYSERLEQQGREKALRSAILLGAIPMQDVVVGEEGRERPRLRLRERTESRR